MPKLFSSQEIFEGVRGVLVDELDLCEDDVSPEDHLEEDLGVDVIDFFEIEVELERLFGVEVDLEIQETVQEVCNSIASCLQHK